MTFGAARGERQFPFGGPVGPETGSAEYGFKFLQAEEDLLLIQADRQKPRRGILREEGGRKKSVGEVPGRVAEFCGFSPFLKRGNMLLKRALEQET